MVRDFFSQWIESDGQRLILDPAIVEPRPISEYHEDMGDVLWWKFPIVEPPYVGSPNDIGQQLVIDMPTVGHCTAYVHGDNSPNAMPKTKIKHPGKVLNIGGWPGYHTHFTMIPTPRNPDDQSTKPKG